MNILLIDHYAGSPEYGMEFRAYYLAKEWARLGHEVTIIGSSFSHLRVRQPKVRKDFSIEYIENIRYVWLKGNTYEGTLKRMVNMTSFVSKLMLHAERIARELRPDVVINSSTYLLDVYPAHKIARFSKGKLIYEIHDLWPMSPMVIGGYSPKHPYIRVLQHAEDYCYRNCDKVISLLWNAQEHIRERHFDQVKFACIPNGYSCEEWEKKGPELPDTHRNLFRSLKNEGRKIIGYSGGHTPSTALNTLLDAAEIMKDRKDVAFVLVGRGVSKENLIASAKRRSLTNVFFLDSVDKTQIPALVHHFDIAYEGGVHSVLHKYGTSANKVTDYLLSGKPILFAIDEPEAIVEKIGCAVRVQAENAGEVAKALESLLNKSESELKGMGERGRKYAVENLEYGILARKFLAEMENI